MSGPFINYTIIDKEIIEPNFSFCYSPSKEKEIPCMSESTYKIC
jgi:hypothetical protein